MQWAPGGCAGRLVSKRKSKAEMPNKLVIAIVDDDESVREALMSLMRALGFVSEAYGCA